jgi:hypothetical protein
VQLDLVTHARVAAAAALSGVDRGTWIRQAITEALTGIVLFDKKRPHGNGDLSAIDDRASTT